MSSLPELVERLITAGTYPLIQWNIQDNDCIMEKEDNLRLIQLSISAGEARIKDNFSG